MASDSGLSGGDSYIGSFISLVSKYEIRYEGVLYYLNGQDSTLGLKNVRSYGTEGRRKEGPQIPPSDKVYEYILFRGSDIKDLQVKSTPPTQTEEQIYNDPAIIQSHAGTPVSVSPSALTGLPDSTRWQDTPALFSRGYPSLLSSNQSVGQAVPLELPPMIKTTNLPSPSMAMLYNGTSIDISHSPQNQFTVQAPSLMSHLLTAQQVLQSPNIGASTAMSLTDASECIIPVSSSSTSTSVHPKFSPSLTPVQFSMSLDKPSSLPKQAFQPSHHNELSMTSFASPRQDFNVNETEIAGKPVSNSMPVLPVQSVPYSVSSFMGLNSSPSQSQSSSLVTPDQLTQSGLYNLSSTQEVFPEQKDVGAFPPASSTLPLIPTPVTQPPLLPLPDSIQKSQYAKAQYTEEFDFMAMNEKFKKDEVWGHLGKGKEKDKTEGAEERATGHNLEGIEGQGLVANQKPAYNKDEFFDTISCNSLNRGQRNVQNLFSERMKLDTETFGFQQRPNFGYGGYGYGRGRGDAFRGSHNWGRGYVHGRRGRGGNVPF
ncbi:protein decapping 5 [Ziziphus jujuba]|uniref:Protein decapping 5 n=1 Tax=Ziziphus jujuba TaxID=326968 RepID=A0A6P4AHS6_ZIZJJ|nr:protein decapping 5 [Ziziphus jujuba]XP_060674408.1 protein decapping 5 [Ziziphus jujuba]